MGMVDLSASYMGLSLNTPLVASASPLTGHLDSLRRLEDAGASAVVLPSLFEEQVTHEGLEVHGMLSQGAESFAEAQGYFPDLEDYNTGPDSYLALVEKASVALDIPVIASLNGSTVGGWVRHARLLQEAGANALELNVYWVAADVEMTCTQVELRYLDLVEAVRAQVDIPLAVKIGPFFNSVAHMAHLIDRSGADGIVLFNRFYQPDIDLERLEVVPQLNLSCSEEMRLPLRWIAILRDRVEASLAASTGIHRAPDAIKVLLAGADVAMMTSALLRNGPEHIATVEAGMRAWLDDREFRSIDEMCGSMSQRSVVDPVSFERSNYMKALISYSSDLRAQ